MPETTVHFRSLAATTARKKIIIQVAGNTTVGIARNYPDTFYNADCAKITIHGVLLSVFFTWKSRKRHAKLHMLLETKKEI